MNEKHDKVYECQGPLLRFMKGSNCPSNRMEATSIINLNPEKFSGKLGDFFKSGDRKMYDRNVDNWEWRRWSYSKE